MPTYLQLAFEANYVGKLSPTIEVWELNGQFYRYAAMTERGPFPVPDFILQSMFK